MPLYQTYLELHPEGESIRHIRRTEPLGFLYGRSSKDIIGTVSIELRSPTAAPIIVYCP